MNYLEPQYQNEFLSKWIYGKLTAKEYKAFRNSKLYSTLVYSATIRKELKTKNS